MLYKKIGIPNLGSFVEPEIKVTDLPDYICHTLGIIAQNGIEGLSMADLKLLLANRKQIDTLLNTRREELWKNLKQFFRNTAIATGAIIALETLIYMLLSPRIKNFEFNGKDNERPQALVKEFQIQFQKMIYRALNGVVSREQFTFTVDDGPPMAPINQGIFHGKACSYLEMLLLNRHDRIETYNLEMCVHIGSTYGMMTRLLVLGGPVGMALVINSISNPVLMLTLLTLFLVILGPATKYGFDTLRLSKIEGQMDPCETRLTHLEKEVSETRKKAAKMPPSNISLPCVPQSLWIESPPSSGKPLKRQTGRVQHPSTAEPRPSKSNLQSAAKLAALNDYIKAYLNDSLDATKEHRSVVFMSNGRRVVFVALPISELDKISDRNVRDAILKDIQKVCRSDQGDSGIHIINEIKNESLESLMVVKSLGKQGGQRMIAGFPVHDFLSSDSSIRITRLTLRYWSDLTRRLHKKF